MVCTRPVLGLISLGRAKKSAEAGRKKFEEGVQKTKDLLEQNVMEELNVSDEATRLKGL